MKKSLKPLKQATKQRVQAWPKEPNDWYVEPEWVSTRLFEQEPFEGSMWDPFAGAGRIVAAAAAVGLNAYGTDILDRGFPLAGTFDFRTINDVPNLTLPDNLIGAPPFENVIETVDLAVSLADRGVKVALILPYRWILASGRSEWMEASPLSRVLTITPRPAILAGQIVFKKPDAYLKPAKEFMAGDGPANGNSDYAWYVWDKKHKGPPELGWCRRDAANVSKVLPRDDRGSG